VVPGIAGRLSRRANPGLNAMLKTGDNDQYLAGMMRRVFENKIRREKGMKTAAVKA